jgi:hypothetical protein
MIIPADEQALALLRAVLDGPYARGVGERTRHVLTQSLAAPEALDKLIFKSHTMALARTLGIAVPDGRTVETLEDARAFAAAAGYPVFLKHSFSWAGAGVVKCADEAELAAALAAMQTGESRLKATLRRLLGRDWYPAQAPIDIQSPIAGRPAMYCACLEGAPHCRFRRNASRRVERDRPQHVRRGRRPCPDGSDVAKDDRGDRSNRPDRVRLHARRSRWHAPHARMQCPPDPDQPPGYRSGSTSPSTCRRARWQALAVEPTQRQCSLDVCLFPYALAADRVPRHLCDIPGADPALAFGRAMLAMIEARHKAEATSLIGDTLAATGIQPIAA